MKIVTAEELERMTPTERRAHFEASIVRDLDDLPPGYLDRIRERIAPRIAERDAQQAEQARNDSPPSA